MYKNITLISLLLGFSWNHASANLEIQFKESAPKDRFTITNSGDCSITDVRLDLDLSKSSGKLIFDTTETGAGVEVFQPFEAGSEAIAQLNADGVKDGDSTLALGVSDIAPGAAVSFTIDVDDTLENSDLGNIRVAGSEIEGGEVKVSLQTGEALVATFNQFSKAMIMMPECQES